MGNNCSIQSEIITTNSPSARSASTGTDCQKVDEDRFTDTDEILAVTSEKRDVELVRKSNIETVTEHQRSTVKAHGNKSRSDSAAPPGVSVPKTVNKSPSRERRTDLDVNGNLTSIGAKKQSNKLKGIIKLHKEMEFLLADMGAGNGVPGVLKPTKSHSPPGSHSSGSSDKKQKTLSWSLNQPHTTKRVPDRMRPSALAMLQRHRIMHNEHRLYEQLSKKAENTVRVPFCISLQFMENVPDPIFMSFTGEKIREDAGRCEFQLKASLYDITYGQFFGRTWAGPWIKAKQSTQEEGARPKLNFNQNVYLHTSINDEAILFIVELVAAVTRDDGQRDLTSCGWSMFRLFRYEGDMVDLSSPATSPAQKMDFLHGSPRALLYMDEPVESNPSLYPISGCQLFYTVRTHKNLSKIHHLVPENVILGAKDIVPGLLDGQVDQKHPQMPPDPFKKPRLQRTTPCFLEKLNINLSPGVETFEEELCKLLNEDRINRDNKIADGTKVEVTERRLQIGVHNGWGYVEKPEVFHLGTDAATRRASSLGSLRRGHQRTNSSGSRSINMSPGGLVLKNRIQLDQLFEDPLCTVVCILEYVIAEPLNREERKMSMVRAQSVTIAVRWLAWSPFSMGEPNHEINLQLQGGPSPVPDACFIYKNPSLAITVDSPEATKLDPGSLTFNFTNQRKLAQDSLMPPDSAQRQHYASVESFEQSMIETPRASSKPPVPPQRESSRHHNFYQPTGTPSSFISGIYSPQSSKDMYLPETPLTYANTTPSQPMMAPHGMMAPHTGSMMAPAQMMHPNYMWMQGYPYQTPAAGPMAYPPYMGFDIYELTETQHSPRRSGASSMVFTPGQMWPPYPYGPMGQPYTHFVDNSGRYGDIHEMAIHPSHSPIIAASPFRQTGTGLSRAAYARLYSVGFPPILDRSGESPDVVDPSDPVHFLPVKEEMDPLQSNEVILQFLAYSRMMTIDAAGPAHHASTVFFTFQFYRFPDVTTERLLLGDPEGDLSSDSKSMPCILKRLEKDGSIQKSMPGYQVKYFVDPTFLKPGEGRLFVEHMSNQTLHIDVWDGDSLLLIGSSVVDLKHLCRQGREAVQITYELDVFASEYGDDTPSLTDDSHRTGSVRPIGVNTILKGRLHLRMANIGFPVDKHHLKDITNNLHKKLGIVVKQTEGNNNFFGGSLNAIQPGPSQKSHKYRAKPLAETHHELASMLITHHEKQDEMKGDEKMDPVRKRKLARMQAIRQQQGLDDKPVSTMAYKTDKAEKTRDLKTIEIYRQHTKKDGILNMLNRAISNEYTIFPTLGSVEFFEFVLKNPYNIQHTVRIHVNDPELQVITDAREWRHFKHLNGLTSPVEEAMFNTDRSTTHPEIFLRPKESVNVPFKFVSFAADHSVRPQAPMNPFHPGQNKLHQQNQEKKPYADTRAISVQFLTEDQKPIAMLSVKVSPQPHIIDQTFRFHQPEQTFLKKSVRLPPAHTLPGSPIGGNGLNQVYVKCTDNNVISSCKAAQPGEPLDVFIKVACGPSPQVKRFFVLLYNDPFMTKPSHVWQFFIHSLQRVDVTCVEGQINRFSLILRGTQASRLVRCYSSHPNELQIEPKEPFMLAANTVHELSVGIRPLHVGSKYLFVNVVDVEYHQLIRSWLVCLTCKNPVVSKAFELSLPVGGGQGSNKRISYTNPYPYQKVFNFRSNRDDLVQFKDTRAEIGPGEAHTIGLRFSPSLSPGVAEILIFINDEEDKNEETFCIKAQYN